MDIDLTNTEKNLPVKHEFANVERTHLLPGIFQMRGGIRNPGAIEIRKDFENGYAEISAPKPLTPFDAVLICIILCKAAQNKKPLYSTTKSKNGIELRTQLGLLKDAASQDCLVYETSARKLIEEMGISWQGHKTCKQIENSLKRIFKTSFIIEKTSDNKRCVYMFHLMSSIKIEGEKEATLAFGINPVLAQALIEPGHFAQIDIKTLINLERSEQLLFICLCNNIDNGKSRKFSQEDLREFLYGPLNAQIIKDTVRKQISRAKNTAQRLTKKLGWEYEENNGIIKIKRPGVQSKQKKPQK